MIRAALEMLAQEPWCYKPWESERLTDWQIEHQYAQPAARRAADARRDAVVPGAAAPAADSVPHEPGGADHRAVIVSAMCNGPFRMSRSDAERAYERQLSEYLAQRKAT